MINRLRLLLIVSVALLQFRCANESAPTGGKEDTEPPKVKKSVPENFSTNFTAGEIKITFNEFVQDNGFAQTLISPATDPAPVIRVNGRVLTIKLKAALEPNTTYTINFGNDLKDLNQGNEYKNFKYVFSTGSYIDSARVSGKISYPENEKDAEGVIVSLYKTEQQNAVLYSKPDYFSRADKSGIYTIENIKAGSYQAYALKDQNLNYIFDQPNELIGFSDTLLELNDTAPASLSLQIFKEAPKKIKLQNVKSAEPGKLVVGYNAPVQTLRLDAKLFQEGFRTYVYPSKDTAIVWFSDYSTKFDSVLLVANDTLLDTARIELKTAEKDSVFLSAKYALRVVNQYGKGLGKVESAPVQSPYESLKIKWNRPVIEINAFKAIEFMADSIKKTYSGTVDISKENPLDLVLSFQQKPSSSYEIFFPDSFVKDLFGVYNKKQSYKYTTAPADGYGNIILKTSCENPQKHYVLWLKNSQNTIVKELLIHGNSQESVTIKNIQAGVYSIQVTEDENANGVWDTGNLLLRKQPEKIIQMPGTHTLKGGWDLEIEVKL